MARPLPNMPHHSVPVVDKDGLVNRSWRDFFAELSRRVPVTGTVTFAAATTAAVTFAAPEASTEYNVEIDAPEDRRFWVTSKTVSGFTLNVSASSSATYGWTLIRR